MTCEDYRGALIESAAAGTVSVGAAAAHLADCAACRAAFAEEQSLFASIDAGLCVTANAEIPPSFVPRVRALITEQSVLPRTWAPARMVFAVAVAASVVILAVQVARHARIDQQRKAPANRELASDVVAPAAPRGVLRSGSASVSPSIVEKRRSGATTKTHQKTPPLDIAETEIIVPPDQELILASYAQYLRRQGLPVVVVDAPESAFQPLKIELIQIAELDVKPLADNYSQ
jgi:hypothetical protein